MIDLAIALALQDAGFGVYGDNIFANRSPILDTGAVSSKDGIWVTATTISYVAGHTISYVAGHYTDQITISTRYYDAIQQGETLLRIMSWINSTLVDACSLSCEPESPIVFDHLDIHPASAIDLDAIDDEGRYVKSIHLTVTYPLPDTSLLEGVS